MLELSGSDALRAWIRPLQENGLIESSEDNTKGKLYFISSDMRKATAKKTAKQLQNEAIREAVINDFMVNRESSLREVADRLSHLASYLIIRRHILKLEEEGKIKSNGQGRWIRFTWVG